MFVPSGQFTTLRSLSEREQAKLLSSDVFKLTYDDWMATPGAKKWSEGQGETTVHSGKLGGSDGHQFFSALFTLHSTTALIKLGKVVTVISMETLLKI